MNELIHKDFKQQVARLTLDLTAGTVTDQRTGRVFESSSGVISVDFIDVNGCLHHIRMTSVSKAIECEQEIFGNKGVNLVEIEIVL